MRTVVETLSALGKPTVEENRGPALCGIESLKMTWCRFDRCNPQVPIQIPNDFRGINGADDPTRTDDLLITSELLYQLSYVGPGGDL